MTGQYKDQVSGLMQRELSRGEFLKYVGVAMLSLVGFVGFIKNLHDTVPDHKKTASGYGGSSYGK